MGLFWYNVWFIFKSYLMLIYVIRLRILGKDICNI